MLRRFKPQGKIPVIIIKDYVPINAPPPMGLQEASGTVGAPPMSPIKMKPVGPLGNRPYFAGEKRRVSRGVMRYVLYPNKIAVYATQKAQANLKEFWANNPQYVRFLRQKKNLYSFDRYLKTKMLLISDPITPRLIQSYLDYALNLKVHTNDILVQYASKKNTFGLKTEVSGKPEKQPYGKYMVKVTFHPVGYVMRFPVWYEPRAPTFKKYAIEKLDMRVKDRVSAALQLDLKIRQTKNMIRKYRARDFIADASSKLYQRSKDGAKGDEVTTVKRKREPSEYLYKSQYEKDQLTIIHNMQLRQKVLERLATIENERVQKERKKAHNRKAAAAAEEQ